MRSRSNRHSGFTLVELLVVVGICAALIAVLLPVLAGARERAQTIVCANNLREISLAMSMYEGHYRAYPISDDPGYGKMTSALVPGVVLNKTWADALSEGKFLGGVDLSRHIGGALLCPSMDRSRYEPELIGVGPHYSYNYFVFPSLDEQSRNKDIVAFSFQGRRSRMAHDSTRMVLLVEAWAFNSYFDENGGREWAASAGPHTISGVGWGRIGGARIELRHARGRAVNVAFFAGNVELVFPVPPPYVPSDPFEDHPFAIARFIRTR